MHYGKQLRMLAYAPWADCYVDWRKLKKLIREIVARSRSTGAPSAPTPLAAHSAGYQVLVSVAGAGSDLSGDEAAPSASAASTSGLSSSAILQRPYIAPVLGSIQHHDSESPSPVPSPSPSPSGASVDVRERLVSGVAVAKEDIDRWLAEFEAERRKVEEFFSAELQLAEVKMDAAAGMSGQHGGDASTMEPMLVKKVLFDALVIVEELADFSRLNLVAFSKLVRKFVKHTRVPLEDALLRRVGASAFVANLAKLDTLKDSIKQTYSRAFPTVQHQVARKGTAAVPAMEDPVRELEQSVAAARSWKRNSILTQFDEYQRKATIRPEAKKSQKSFIPAIVALVLLILLLCVPILPADKRPAQRCLAITVAATVLWVAEPWPLFVTSLGIPLLVTLCGVLLDSAGTVMEPMVAAKVVFQSMFPSNIALVLAGFSIAQAFAKYGLDVKIATLFLRAKFWNTPYRFVIAVELLTFCMSAFISNVAASVLLMTVTMPVIRGLPKRSTYAKTILMATAVSGNIGGMTTQIASPQNAVSAGLGDYTVDFVHFSLVSLPVTPLLLVAGHFLVLWMYKPDVAELPKLGAEGRAKSDVETAADIIQEQQRQRLLQQQQQQQHPQVGKIDVPWWRTLAAKQYSVVLISLLSVGLWTSSPWLKPFGKSIGVISLVPLVLFYGSRLLGKEDFERMPWPLAILLSGGNVLGSAVDSSKLLELAASLILHMPQNLWLINVLSCCIMMLAGSFVSHTVAALVLLRLFARVGDALGHAKLLVMTSIVMDSGAMPLPISSFPNINTFSVENADGESYLKTTDFLKVGIPCTLLAFIGCNTITCGIGLLFNL
jgi:phosphate transporter